MQLSSLPLSRLTGLQVRFCKWAAVTVCEIYVVIREVEDLVSHDVIKLDGNVKDFRRKLEIP
jgi:hypothetical protein